MPMGIQPFSPVITTVSDFSGHAVHADGRVRLLAGLEVEPQTDLCHGFGDVELQISVLIKPGLGCVPQLQ